MQPQYAGDSKFFLVFTPAIAGPEGNVGIDVDVSGWIEEHKALFRTPGTWFLVDKDSGAVIFCVLLGEGDQFFYTKRHTGNLMGGRENISVGMGKKQADGTEVKLWLMPNGMVCGGEDVDEVAVRLLG